MSNDTRQSKGQPIGGQYAPHKRSEALISLTESQLPVGVHAGWSPLAVADHYGQKIHVSVNPDDRHTFQVWDDTVSAEFHPDTHYGAAAWSDMNDLLKHAHAAFDTALMERAKSRLGYVRELDSALEREITLLDQRAKGSHGLTVPGGWDGEYELSPASDWIGRRMQGGDVVANRDPICARCDYAEVDEDGVSYGYNISPSLLGEIVAGPQHTDETDDEYASRVNESANWSSAQLTEFFQEEYGADCIQSGDSGDIVIEFCVEYGPEGPEGTSIESMGGRAERETKLLQARNDWMYRGTMQAKLAKKLGYQPQGRYDTLGTRIGTTWVKPMVTIS